MRTQTARRDQSLCERTPRSLPRKPKRRCQAPPGSIPRRGLVAAQVVIVLTVLLGFVALGVDTAYMWNVRADLQRTTDAAVLASAAMLAEVENPADQARAAAYDFVERNPVLGGITELELSGVQLGKAQIVDGDYVFEQVADDEFPDAVRIQLSATRSLFFAPVLGRQHSTVSAQATALLVPRDIVVVADLSASHNDDSELGSYRDTNINIWEVWDGLPGGSDSEPSLWTEEELAEIPLGEADLNYQTAGPGWGYMKELLWGEETLDDDYEPNNDPGFIHLARYGSSPNDWTDPNLETYLSELTFEADAQYSANEVQEILDTGHHGNATRYRRQVAVALGLARWNSGKAGGAWQSIPGSPGGNGDDRIDGNELTWIEPFFNKPNPGNEWLNYIYRTQYSSRATSANSHFYYQFGVKTLVNYLLERRWEHSDIPELAATPHQPMQAVKDSVETMVEIMNTFEHNDQIGLVVYGYSVQDQVELQMQPNLELITTGLDGLSNMQAGHYDGWTNMGGGLEAGIEMITTSPARPMAHKMIVLLTDGNANINPDGEWPSGSWADQQQILEEARDYVTDQAAIAADNRIRVFAVSVGAYADAGLMEEVAAITNGEHLEATSGDIATYADQLEEIFARLGGKRPVELIH